MPSGRFIAEQSTCAPDAPGGVLQACLEVAKALSEQENLQSGACGNVEQTAGIRLGLNQRRSLLNSTLRQLQCARARTHTEFGMKARCFRQVKDSLGADDTRVADLAVAILDEAAALFSLPSPEGLNGYLETGNDTSTRTAWRSGLFHSPGSRRAAREVPSFARWRVILVSRQGRPRNASHPSVRHDTHKHLPVSPSRSAPVCAAIHKAANRYNRRAWCDRTLSSRPVSFRPTGTSHRPNRGSTSCPIQPTFPAPRRSVRRQTRRPRRVPRATPRRGADWRSVHGLRGAP